MGKTRKIGFHAIKTSDGCCFVKSSLGGLIAQTDKLGGAERIAAALNGVLRKETFKPKNAGRRPRQKGHQFEREISIALREVYPEARRQLEYHSKDANGIDIQNTGPFAIQCKKLKKYAPISRIEEVQADPLIGNIPVLITAGDGKPPMAVLGFTDFLWLIKSLKN